MPTVDDKLSKKKGLFPNLFTRSVHRSERPASPYECGPPQ